MRRGTRHAPYLVRPQPSGTQGAPASKKAKQRRSRPGSVSIPLHHRRNTKRQAKVTHRSDRAASPTRPRQRLDSLPVLLHPWEYSVVGFTDRLEKCRGSHWIPELIAALLVPLRRDRPVCSQLRIGLGIRVELRQQSGSREQVV